MVADRKLLEAELFQVVGAGWKQHESEKRKKTLRCKKGESQNDLLQNYPDKISRIDRFLTTSLLNSVYTLMNSTFAGFEHNMGMKLL